MTRRWFFQCVFGVFCCSSSVSSLFSLSSYAEFSSYPQFCMQAAQDPGTFSSFKIAPVYVLMLEHVSYEQGWDYLKVIREQTPEILSRADLFRQNDLLGSPVRYSYGDIGVFSPTTIRYMKVASDLIKQFGSLDNLHIVEIGGGYGGQCVVLSKLFNFASYTIIDLPGPIALTEKYLKTLGVENVIFQKAGEVPENQKYDLAISNYAFSECAAEVQEEYLKKVLLVSKKGYLTCNYFYGLGGVMVLTKNELFQKLKNGKIECKELPEVPLTNANNYIVVWN